MARQQSSQEMGRGYGRQPQVASPKHRRQPALFGSPNSQPRQAQRDSRDVSNCQRPTDAVDRQRLSSEIARPGVLYVGDLVSVWSQMANKWVDARVDKVLPGLYLNVIVQDRGIPRKKQMHLHSKNLKTPTVAADTIDRLYEGRPATLERLREERQNDALRRDKLKQMWRDAMAEADRRNKNEQVDRHLHPLRTAANSGTAPVGGSLASGDGPFTSDELTFEDRSRHRAATRGNVAAPASAARLPRPGTATGGGRWAVDDGAFAPDDLDLTFYDRPRDRAAPRGNVAAPASAGNIVRDATPAANASSHRPRHGAATRGNVAASASAGNMVRDATPAVIAAFDNEAFDTLGASTLAAIKAIDEAVLRSSSEASEEADLHVITNAVNDAVDEEECIVCMDSAANVLLNPCGHSNLCSSCAQHLNPRICPFCRIRIEEVIPLSQAGTTRPARNSDRLPSAPARNRQPACCSIQ